MRLAPSRRLMLLLAILAAGLGAFGAFRAWGGRREPPRLAPVGVMAMLRLPGVTVVARKPPARPPRGRFERARVGEPVPVELTAYCLKGTTRRGRYVRKGIVAADPRIFPLGRYVEVFVGGKYHGRFLVDDTGLRIKGPILDVWVPSCDEARAFGRKRGSAVLLPRPGRRG